MPSPTINTSFGCETRQYNDTQKHFTKTIQSYILYINIPKQITKKKDESSHPFLYRNNATYRHLPLLYINFPTINYI